MTPRVRVVVVNYDGAGRTARCLESLDALDWPPNRLEVVVVDNDGGDGVADLVRSQHPSAVLVEPGRNLGFAGGANRGLADLTRVDHVALVNNDAMVEAGWLSPLVEALEADPGVGAATSKILFAPSFLALTLHTDAHPPGRGDSRPLGVRLSGVEVGGPEVWVDAWSRAHLVSGFFGVEFGSGDEATYEWTGPVARMHLPVPRGGQPALDTRLRLAGARPQTVVLEAGDRRVVHLVGPEPAWYEAPVAGATFDVVNNAGSYLAPGGFGSDRGLHEPDDGRYDAACDVFAWCGAAVLLRRAYVESVGRFDDRFFLYYEDFDLSWRGRAQGWRHRYVPTSVVRHEHTGTSVQGSALFQHHVERNRLLTLTRNAPAPMAAGALARHVAVTGSYARRDLVSPLLRGERPRPETVLRRSRALAGFLALAPTAGLAERRRLRARQVVSDADLLDDARALARGPSADALQSPL